MSHFFGFIVVIVGSWPNAAIKGKRNANELRKRDNEMSSENIISNNQ